VIRLILIIFSLLVFSTSGSAAGRQTPWDKERAVEEKTESYWHRSEEGYFWYKDPALEKKEPLASPVDPSPKPVKPVQAKKERQKELDDFESMKQNADDALKVAIMTQSQADIERYLRLQKEMELRSLYFSQGAQRVVWTNPDLDASMNTRPTNSAAMDVYDTQQKELTARTVAEIGKSHGLFFFFRSDCPYCHKFAPTLKRYAAERGLSIMPISLDGGGLPDFPQYQTDNGVATRLDVKSVPALFLVSPSEKSIIPVGYGLMSTGELNERINSLINEPVGQQPQILPPQAQR